MQRPYYALERNWVWVVLCWKLCISKIKVSRIRQHKLVKHLYEEKKGTWCRLGCGCGCLRWRANKYYGFKQAHICGSLEDFVWACLGWYVDRLFVLSVMSKMIHKFRIASLQLIVGANKKLNLVSAQKAIHHARKQGADIIVLPECFNSPYSTVGCFLPLNFSVFKKSDLDVNFAGLVSRVLRRDSRTEWVNFFGRGFAINSNAVTGVAQQFHLASLFIYSHLLTDSKRTWGMDCWRFYSRACCWGQVDHIVFFAGNIHLQHLHSVQPPGADGGKA